MILKGTWIGRHRRRPYRKESRIRMMLIDRLAHVWGRMVKGQGNWWEKSKSGCLELGASAFYFESSCALGELEEAGHCLRPVSGRKQNTLPHKALCLASV